MYQPRALCSLSVCAYNSSLEDKEIGGSKDSQAWQVRGSVRDCVSKGEAESYKERNPALMCGELHAYTHTPMNTYTCTHMIFASM